MIDVTKLPERELLELAAAALGLQIFDWCESGSAIIHPYELTSWNPITDKADAFSLQVALKMDVSQVDGIVIARHECLYGIARVSEFSGQPEEIAYMHAFTRCAAEVALQKAQDRKI